MAGPIVRWRSICPTKKACQPRPSAPMISRRSPCRKNRPRNEKCMKLNSEQKQFWEENGYLAVEDVIPREVIEAEKKRFDWLCAHWDSAEAQKLVLSTRPACHETNGRRRPSAASRTWPKMTKSSVGTRSTRTCWTSSKS